MATKRKQSSGFLDSLSDIFIFQPHGTSSYGTSSFEMWREIYRSRRLSREFERDLAAQANPENDVDIKFAKLVERLDKYRRWGWL
jgi:hypothetical protein